MDLFPPHPKLQSLMLFTLRLYLCGCWVKATTVAERPRIAEGGEGQQDLHVGCWAVRSVVSLNHPLACGMEAVSSCMPVVRARPTHPQLFLSSYSFSLSCSLFLHLSHPFRVVKAERKMTGEEGKNRLNNFHGIIKLNISCSNSLFQLSIITIINKITLVK